MSVSLENERVSGRSAPALWKAFAHGVRDNLMGEFAVQGLRVGGTIVLARELAPADFGLLKVLVIIAMFATLFSESGIPDAVIQRRDLTPEHEATAWWLSLALASATVAALYFGAPIIARAMAMKKLVLAIRLLCVPLFLEGTAIIPVARLARNLNFTALATADVIAEIGFLTVAFTLLWHGRGEWCLPGGLAARFATHAISVWFADHRIPVALPRIHAARDIGRFAITVLGGRIVTVASGNADYVLVGRLLGPTMLGYYTIAWDLLRFIPDRLHRVVGRVALPTFCRLHDANREIADAYCNFLQYLARVVLPVAACVAIAAPHLLTTIYGKQWLPAAIPMRLLACGLGLAALRMANTPVYYAKNYPSLDLFLNGTRLILIVGGVLLTAHTGLIGVSASVGAVEGLISIAGQYAVCVIIGLHVSHLVAAILPSLGATALCAVAALLGSGIASVAGLTGPAALVCLALTTAVAFLWLEGSRLRDLVSNAFERVDVRSVEGPVD